MNYFSKFKPQFLSFFYNLVFLLLLVAIKPSLAQAASQTLYNPLPVAQELYCPTAACDLITMFLLVIKYFLAIIPVVSVLFVIIGGFKMVTSAGNEEALIKAKKTVLWAVLGLVFALLSFSLIAIVQNLFGVNIK